MKSSPAKQNSVMESLIDAFGEVIDAGARDMNDAELKRSEKKFNDAVDRAVARPT